MQRDLFQNRIYKGLIGAGSDSYGLPDEEEIISDYPLQRYFSGIIFPEKETSSTESDEDEARIQSESETEEPNVLSPEEISLENETEENLEPKKEKILSEDESKVNQNHFHPNNFGLTFCIEKSRESIEIEFSAPSRATGGTPARTSVIEAK